MKIILFLFILSVYSVYAENDCGDWVAYKDDKCIKLFDSVGLQSFTDAEKTCSANDNSKLSAIYSAEEQAFLAHYLFSEKAVVDNVWLGARYSNVSRHFQWEDGSNFTFVHWAPGNPKHVAESSTTANSLPSCVQMHAETEILGKWSNEPCAKKNLVVCEKEQRWSLDKMQLMIKKMMRQQQTQQPPNPTTLESTVPIGFVYVQLPKEKSPSEIWSKHLIWTEVSQAYSGVFFRVAGGNAAQFGSVQEESLPFIDQIEYTDCQVRPKNMCNFTTLTGVEMSSPKAGNGWSGNVITAAGFNVNDDTLNIEGEIKYTGTLNFHTKSAEVRPKNMAVKIWKRTG